MLGVCCGPFSSTSTSRSRGPGPSSGRRRIGASGTRTGSASTRRATRMRGSRPSPTCGCTPSSCTTRRSGSRSPRTSCAAWAATPEGARACAVEIVRRWEIHANFDLYDDAIPVLEELRGPRAPDRADLERPARPRGVRAPPRARRRRRGRLEEPRPHEAARLDLRDRPCGARRRGRRDGDGRRLLRGRHRGRPRARHARDPARPRRAPSAASPTASPTSARCRRRSASSSGFELGPPGGRVGAERCVVVA